MKSVDTNNKLPIKFWLDNDDENVYKQASNLANLPFAYKHIALMPDAHLGHGMPIGGVIACKDVIIPHAVGSDIGCGVCAINTKLDVTTVPIKEVLSEIRKLVPVGTKRHKKKIDFLTQKMPELPQIGMNSIIHNFFSNSVLQLGTLGSSNHFVELQKDVYNSMWVMIHSGSRNLGYSVGKHYNKVAVELNEKWFSKVLKSHELAFLPVNSSEGKNYIDDMNYCVEYAKANRKVMMHNCLLAIKNVTHNDISFETYIDVAHNYARLEHHFNKNVWVHRKGATSAREGELGLIPGSQGTNSYVVKGKGNKQSFTSCSHGAGRTMSRTVAKNTLDFDAEVKRLEDRGIIHTIRSKDNLDEATGSYKNIYEVMRNQSDLVNIIDQLEPVACIKG